MPLSETDRRLIKDLLTGSEGTWDTFIDRYAGLVVQVIRHTAHAHSLRLTQDDEDDLCADVFAALVDRRMATLRNFRGRSSLATWLTVVVRRIVIRKLTQRRYASALGHVHAHNSAVEQATESVESNLANRDEVESLMKRLPPESQEAVRLFYWEGLSYWEISRKLGVAANTIGPMLSRIRHTLTLHLRNCEQQ
ncbi:MAG: sigma-70 family RNA polymerase sigma factor [Fuerstiella sp.]|nr:sigma-70 family RNA polymerase sigma factor [Fuerstiella sp.]